MKKKLLALALVAVMVISCTACSCSSGSSNETIKAMAQIDNSAWKYNSDDNVYYQIGLTYCEKPVDTTYETLAIFVPAGYMDATDNGNGTYTCKINESNTVGKYTAGNAPIVMPINTPGYSAMEALTSYSSYTDYTNAGLVYVHAGCRGRDAGAPAGVTDLKAAVRFIRYIDAGIPGNSDYIFTFGMSGGGAQSALIGSTGDSSLYEPYLQQIGALSNISDAVCGSMCWCPITNLDTADEGYEWMMGTTRSGLSTDEQTISDELAKAFANYINQANIKNPNGEVLKLAESVDGIYQSGSYYDYMKSVIERSLNNFLADTTFPYDASSSSSKGGGMQGGGMPSGGEKPSGGGHGEKDKSSSDSNSTEANDNISRSDTSNSLSLSGTYNTPQEYIDAMNANGTWVNYDVATNTATITSIKDFVKAFKSTSKELGAFDQLDASQGENTLFGYGDGNGAHFDKYLADILTKMGNSYASSYTSDLTKKDSAGNTVDVRVNMYNPMYYLVDSYAGYKSANVAKYWRIRTGIAQSDCALSTEMNLSLALMNYDGVNSVDFETIWGAGHTEAERSGNSTDNFITWVNECMSTNGN